MSSLHVQPKQCRTAATRKDPHSNNNNNNARTGSRLGSSAGCLGSTVSNPVSFPSCLSRRSSGRIVQASDAITGVIGWAEPLLLATTAMDLLPTLYRNSSPLDPLGNKTDARPGNPVLSRPAVHQLLPSLCGTPAIDVVVTAMDQGGPNYFLSLSQSDPKPGSLADAMSALNDALAASRPGILGIRPLHLSPGGTAASERRRSQTLPPVENLTPLPLKVDLFSPNTPISGTQVNLMASTQPPTPVPNQQQEAEEEIEAEEPPVPGVRTGPPDSCWSIFQEAYN